MPKDTSRRGAASSRTSFNRLFTAAPEREAVASPTLPSTLPFPVPRGYRRDLPQEFFDRIDLERRTGRPHRYTTKEVKAIVEYVSNKPVDVTAIQHLRDTVSRTAQTPPNAVVNAGLPSRPLIDRIERPSLASRISEARTSATYTPIAPKPTLLDFKKLTPEDTFNIFKVRINATLDRLNAPYERREFDDLPDVTREQLVKLYAKFDKLAHFEDRYKTVTPEQWQQLQFGLKAIGNISFAGLRYNYRKICASIAGVYLSGYFDWV